MSNLIAAGLVALCLLSNKPVNDLEYVKDYVRNNGSNERYQSEIHTISKVIDNVLYRLELVEVSESLGDLNYLIINGYNVSDYRRVVHFFDINSDGYSNEENYPNDNAIIINKNGEIFEYPFSLPRDKVEQAYNNLLKELREELENDKKEEPKLEPRKKFYKDESLFKPDLRFKTLKGKLV